MSLNDRPTADLIVVFLTVCVGAVMMIVLIGAIILQTLGEDPSDSVMWVARLTNTIIGGIFGYLAGRSVATKTNGNDK